MSLFYCCIHLISSSWIKSCCSNPSPLNRRIQSTYPRQYAFCPSSEFISSSFAIHTINIRFSSCGNCYIIISLFSRSFSSSSCIFLFPSTSTAVFLFKFLQRSLFKNRPTYSHISFCILNSSLIKIRIQICKNQNIFENFSSNIKNNHPNPTQFGWLFFHRLSSLT